MKKIIVANWKMNPQFFTQAKNLFGSVKKRTKNLKNLEVIICPPFIFLSLLKPNQKIKLGAQNCFWQEKGPFTGEISPLMLKNLNCEYVILGHSERRILGETDEIINKKIKEALKTKLKPILCIGETLKERKNRKTFAVLKNQIKKDLKNINFNLPIIIAYEPVWAIGTGVPCKTEEAKTILKFLRKKFKKNPILYGGSVNSENTKDYIKIGFNGLLIGGASLKEKEFLKILEILRN